MFRIERNLVNLAASQGNNTENIAGVSGYNGPVTPASAQERAREIIDKAEAEAALILQNAGEQAARIIEDAEEKSEQDRAKAWQSGYEEGAESAKLDYEDKIVEDDEALRGVMRELYKERVSALEEIEPALVELSLEIARKIIGDAIDDSSEVFKSMIVNALRRMEVEGKLVIRVSPQDFERFFSSGNAVFELGDGISVTASVIKDAALVDGSCTIDSDTGSVNAGVDNQLKLIKLAFSKAVDYE